MEATISNNADVNSKATVIAATYKNGILQKVKTKLINMPTDNTQNVTYSFGKIDADRVKIFVWNSLNGMIPFDEKVEMDIEYSSIK